MANKKTNKTKPTPATKKVSKPAVKSENKKEVAKKPATDNKSKTTDKTPVVKKKRTALKATLITLASVLGAGALGVGGYYVWNHFEVSPVQPAVDKEIQAVIYMMDALNENSTKADFDAVDKAYKALTVKQQERLEENDAFYRYTRQKVLYDTDAKNVNKFHENAELLDKAHCTQKDLDEINDFYKTEIKDINRGSDFRETIIKARDLLQAATEEHGKDKNKVDDFVLQVDSLVDKITTFTKSEYDKVAGMEAAAVSASEARKNEFQAAIAEAKTKLDKANQAYKDDEEKVKDFADMAGKLTPETCTTDEYEKLSKLQEAANKVTRGNDFKKQIEEAEEKCKAIIDSYTNDAKIIDGLKAEMEKFDIATCTQTEITAFQTNVSDIKDKVKRVDKYFDEIKKEAEDKVKAADEAYEVDKAEIKAFVERAKALAANKATCTGAQLEEIKKDKQEKIDIIKRGEDFADDIKAIGDNIKEADNAYNYDAEHIHKFATKVNEELNPDECTFEEIDDIKKADDYLIGKEAAKTRTQDTVLVGEFNAAEAILDLATTNFAADRAKVDKFKETIPENLDACTGDEIEKAITEYQKVKDIKREDLKKEVSEEYAKLDAAHKTYEAQEEIVIAFENAVKDLENCSAQDLDDADKAAEATVGLTTRSDLVDRITEANTTLSTAHTEYEADLAKVEAFEAAVRGLEEVKESCDNATILAVVDGEARSAVTNISRSDLRLKIDAAEAKLAEIRELYADDANAVKAYEDCVNELYEAIDSCSKARINEAKNLRDNVKIRGTDFSARLETANGKLAAIELNYSGDQTKVNQFVEAANQLGEDFTKAQFDDAKTAKAAVDAIHDNRKADFTEELTLAYADFANAEIKYGAADTDAKVVTVKIDDLYNAKSITQTNIDDIKTRYDNLSSLAKDIADDTCTTDHGNKVSNIMSTIQTQFTEGAPMNELIAPLGTNVPATDVGKIHLLSIIDKYNAIKDDTNNRFKLKAITSDNQDKIESLIEKMSDVDLKTAYVSNLNGPDVTGSVEYAFSNTYGNIASVTGGEPSTGPQYAYFMNISADEANNLKKYYSQIIFYFSVGVSPSSTSTPSLHIDSNSTSVGELDPIEARDTFYKVTLNMNNAIDDYPLIFKITDAVGATITITNLYGIPR